MNWNESDLIRVLAHAKDRKVVDKVLPPGVGVPEQAVHNAFDDAAVVLFEDGTSCFVSSSFEGGEAFAPEFWIWR